MLRKIILCLTSLTCGLALYVINNSRTAGNRITALINQSWISLNDYNHHLRIYHVEDVNDEVKHYMKEAYINGKAI